MRFNPIRGFRNRDTRPRFILWSGVLLIALVLVTVGSLVGTSVEWFCTEPCHVVHYDNTAAYRQSTHTRVSCIACHEPVNASPLEFVLMKVFVLPDVPATIFGYYELPPNEGSYVAVEMPTEQCTQCHNMQNRIVTSSQGILIDHDVHEEYGATCTTCHNRVAHPEENIEITLEGNRKHENWMTMDACFRCHALTGDAEAPGRCSACHPPEFELVPKTHAAQNWHAEFGDSSGHAQAAAEESASVEAAVALAADFEEPHEPEGPVLAPSSTINSCYTCHEQTYCDDCHGVPMPHPAGFVGGHGETARENADSCTRCHARSATEAATGIGACDACHHPGGDADVPWLQRHPAEVRDQGAQPCYRCHEATYCAACHVKVSTGR